MRKLKNYWPSKIVPLLFLLLQLIACNKKNDDYVFEKIQLNTTHNIQALETRPLSSVQTLIAAGGERWHKAVLFRSNDSGATWQEINLDASFDKSIYTCKSTKDTLFFAGDSGLWGYYVYQNGLVVRKQLANWMDVETIEMGFNTGEFLAVGQTLQKGGIINTLDINGNILNEQYYNISPKTIYRVPLGKVYVGGYGAVLRTSNGNSYEYLDIKNDNFISIVSSATEIYVAGSNGTIRYTNDSGNNWTILKRSKATDKFTAMIYLDYLNKVWAAGDNGLLVEIDTKTKAWQYIKTPITNNINALQKLPRGFKEYKIILASDNGMLWQTTVK